MRWRCPTARGLAPLCLFDFESRQFSSEDFSLLRDLASMAALQNGRYANGHHRSDDHASK